MKNVVLDFRASSKTIDALKRMNYNVIKTPRIATLYTTICGHGDVMVFNTNKGDVIVEPTVYDYFEKSILDTNVVCGKTYLREKYPFDIAYNAALVGDYIICNENFTDEKILEFADKNGIKILNTKQGYAKCSICIISDNAIITSDKHIAIVAEKNKIDVLAVDDSSIELIGFEHGFIGGATGLIDKNILAVNGDINFHKDCNRILDFCNQYKIKLISLNDGPIIDIGSIILI